MWKESEEGANETINQTRFINNKQKIKHFMRKKLNFCGIVEHSPKVLSFGKTQIYLFFRSLTRTFATAFIAATIILVSSCSQDDDFYESDMYTMAEELETRAGEPGGGGESKPSKIRCYESSNETFIFANGNYVERGTLAITYEASNNTFSDLTCTLDFNNRNVDIEPNFSYTQTEDSIKVILILTITKPDVGVEEIVDKSHFISKSKFK